MDKVTWQEFAAALKAKYPEYKDIPDTQFVDAVLTRYPEWKSKVYGANVTEQQRAQLSVPPGNGGRDALHVTGMVSLGNIDLDNRPVVHNPDGSISTELSFSRGTSKGEVLVPQVVNGRILSQDAAWQHYLKTGENLGTFDTPANADAYAKQVHARQDEFYHRGGRSKSESVSGGGRDALLASLAAGATKPRGFDVHPVRYGVGVTPEQEAGETERRQARREAEHQANARKGFLGRIANRMSSQGEALEDTITGLVKMGEPGTAEYRQMVDYLRHPRRTQEAREHPIVNAVEGITQGIPPIGMFKDWLKDPANLAGDALTAYTMGAAEAPGEFTPPQNRYPTGTGIKAGPLRGSYTRSGLTMDMLDALAKDKPIPHEGYKVVQKALSLEKYGWRAPEWMRKYADMVESGLRGGKEPIPGRPGEFVDRPPSMNPLTYEHARNFEVAAGEKIDWSDPGGRMNAMQKQARKAIGEDIANGLKPYGWDRPYLQAKADFTKAYGAETKWPRFGKWGGRLAGYMGGSAVGHPFILGYGGGQLGESAAGQLVRSITRAGKRGAEETELDMATRRGGGGVSPADRLRMATDRVNSIKMHLARNPGDYNAVSQLRVAEDAMAEASKGMWPEQYRQAPQTLGKQGGAGANYAADSPQLAEIKRKLGIK
jgi:hypothetical protein